MYVIVTSEYETKDLGGYSLTQSCLLPYMNQYGNDAQILRGMKICIDTVANVCPKSLNSMQKQIKAE